MKNSIVIVILLCLFSSTVKGQSLRTYNFDKKEVIIIPDNDNAGNKYAVKILESQ